VIDASNTAWAEYMMGRFVGLHGSADVVRVRHVPTVGTPQTAVLDRALREPLAASRVVTADLARALRILGAR
jgi:hypothetical protein